MEPKEKVFIYESSKTSAQDLIEKGHNPLIVQLAFSIATAYEMQQKTEMITNIDETRTSDHQPCHECGGIFFLRTGTCHVCQTCGENQGCS